MKLLVTGGAGFIGSNFIHYWFKHHPNDEIWNLDKLTYAGNLENLKEFTGRPNYKFILGDIISADVTMPLVRDCDVVVHFAAESHVDRSIMGDIDFNSVSKKASFITPVPGGIGPMTIAMLLENTLKAFEIK